MRLWSSIKRLFPNETTPRTPCSPPPQFVYLEVYHPSICRIEAEAVGRAAPGCALSVRYIGGRPLQWQ